MMKDKLQAIKSLLDFINRSPSSRQASVNICSCLEYAEFERLDEGASWMLKSGRGYYVEVYGSSLVSIWLDGELGAAGVYDQYGMIKVLKYFFEDGIDNVV